MAHGYPSRLVSRTDRAVVRGLVAAGVVGLFGAAPAPGETLRGSGYAFPDVLPAMGQALEVVGQFDMESSDPPFDVTPSTREYTWTLYGSVVHEIREPSSGIRYLDLTFGVLEVRSDASFNSIFRPNPPNALVPSTFHDGEVVLLGSVTELTIREIFGIVTASGQVRFEAGSGLPDMSSGHWAVNAALSMKGGETPEGYGSRWNLEVSPSRSVHVNDETWSKIKALYR
jgi:hypothetical protein